MKQTTLQKMSVSLDVIASAVVWVQSNGQIEWCNPAFTQLIQCSPSQILGFPFPEIFPLKQSGKELSPSDYPHFQLQQGSYFTQEYEFSQNNQTFVLEISGRWLSLAEDSVAILTLQDKTLIHRLQTDYQAQATEYQQAEHEREAYLSILKATLEATADGILVINRERNVPVYNQKFLQLWSVPEELMTADKPNERLQYLANQTVNPEAFITKVWDLFLKFPEQEILDKIEFKDGRIFERYSQPQWKGKEVIGRVWSFRDITEQQKIEASLRESEERLRTLINATPDIICFKDGDGRWLEANQSSQEFVSPERVDYKGKTDLELATFSPYSKALISCAQSDEETWQKGSLHREEETVIQADGSAKTWDMIKVPLFHEDGRRKGLVVLGREISDRKRAEEARQRSEAQYRDLVQTANCIILRWDTQGNIAFINDYGQRILGFESYEIFGKNVVGTIVPETETSGRDLQVLMAEICLHPEKFLYNENENLCKDGKRLWIAWANKPIFDSQGNLIEILSVGTDATERKQVQSALENSLSLLQATFDSIQDGILAINRAGEIISYNQKFLEMWSVTPDILGEPDHIKRINYLANQLENPEEFRQRVVSLYETPEADSYDILHLRDGRVFERYSCPQWLSNDIVGRIWTFRDVTERKGAEEALRLIVEGTAAQTGNDFFRACVRYLAQVLEARYALVTELVNTEKNKVRTLAFWNGQEFGENFEYNPQGAPCEKVFEDQMLCYYEENLQQLFPHDVDLVTIQAESYLGVPLTDASGTVLGHLAVIDVKPMKADPGRELILKIFAARTGAELGRKQTEEALWRAKEAAESANRAKSTFLANMSHELRTPLNAILGFAQLMERDRALTPRQRDSLATINRSGEHLLNLINDVLEMSKIEAGRIVLNPAPFDLHRLLETIQEMFEIRAKAKQLFLEFEIASQLPRYISTDEGKLRQVLINLLSNAVKFTSTGGVTLRSSVTGKTQAYLETTYDLYFEVADTGEGISPQESKQLFQPFVQTVSGAQATEGTGLGLTISRQFVRLMGGDIHLTSTVGVGSTFSFSVRVNSAHREEVATPSPYQQVLKLAPHTEAYRILVVDDRPENCDLMTQLLETVGFEAQTAANGQEAIALWQSWQPHLIWMDMRMPILDGYEATRQIRAQEPNMSHRTVIIALTASAFEEQHVNIIGAGCDDFVRKPFREQVIFEKIAQYLGVEYIYLSEAESSSHADRLSLTPESLQVMSEEWKAQFHQAALEVDAEKVLQLIKQIPASHRELATALENIVNRFEFDELLELTSEE